MKHSTQKGRGRLVIRIAAFLLLTAALVALFWNPIFRGVVHPLYTNAKLNSFQKQAQTAQKGQIVFLGDSVVDSWDLGKDFPEQTTYNLGIMGDATAHMEERLDEVYSFEPGTIVLFVGTNDFLNERLTVQQAVEGYSRILAEIQQNCPEAQVLCLALYPGYDTLLYKIEKWRTSILELNTHIEALAASYGYTFVDSCTPLLDAETSLVSKRYCKDGIHPSDEGYALLAEILKPYL